MGIETQKRVGRLWREGKWRQDDEGAKAFYNQYKDEIDEYLNKELEEPKPTSEKKRGK